MHLKWNCVWEVVKVKLFSDKIYKFARFFVNIPETNKQNYFLMGNSNLTESVKYKNLKYIRQMHYKKKRKQKSGSY